MRKIKVAAMGVEHRHIFSQLKGMLDLGCECIGWWNDGDNKITQDFNKKYPSIKRESDKKNLLSNLEIDLVLIADIPNKRASLAIECMEAGKDVMLDKPGCTSLAQLKEIEKTVAKTQKIFSIDFSEIHEHNEPIHTNDENLINVNSKRANSDPMSSVIELFDGEILR